MAKEFTKKKILKDLEIMTKIIYKTILTEQWPYPGNDSVVAPTWVYLGHTSDTFPLVRGSSTYKRLPESHFRHNS